MVQEVTPVTVTMSTLTSYPTAPTHFNYGTWPHGDTSLDADYSQYRQVAHTGSAKQVARTVARQSGLDGSGALMNGMDNRFAFGSSSTYPTQPAAPQQYYAEPWSRPAQYRMSGNPSVYYPSPDIKAWSDGCNTAWASPELSSNNASNAISARSSMDGTSNMMVTSMAGPGESCISLSDVQQFDEPESDIFAKDLSGSYLPSMYNTQHAATYPPPQITVEPADRYFPSGYAFAATLDPPDTSSAQAQHRPSEESDSAYASSSSNIHEQRQRRKHSQSLSGPALHSSKVTKRNSAHTMRRLSAPLAMSAARNKTASPSRGSRSSQSMASFPCPLAPYGCTSAFGSKNEWKRHVNTQHLRLDLWRCDQCNDRDTRPNDFNRKDLFIQHLRRMHHKPSEDTSNKTAAGATKSRTSSSATSTNLIDDTDPAIVAAEQRCYIRVRHPPSRSCCLLCSADFEGPGSWEERMEHVGRHFEQHKKEGKGPRPVSAWRVDMTVERWLEAEGLISRNGYEWQLADGRRQSAR